MRIKGYMCIILAATLWGLIGPISRLALSEGLEPMEVAFWRAALAWLFFGAHAAIKREMSMRIRDLPIAAVFALSGVTLFYVSYQYAVNQGGAALAAVLLYTAPAWVAVISPMIFKEPMPPVKMIALALTLMGIVGVSLGAGGVRGELVFESAAALSFSV